MATLTTKQFKTKLNRQLREIKKLNKPLAIAAVATHSEYVKRIFDKNQKSNLSVIGTKYSPGYAKVRRKKGRQTSRVDLKFTNQLFSDVANSLTRKNSFRWVSELKRLFNVEKVENLEKLYGRIFDLSRKERQLFLTVLQAQYFKALS